MVRKGKLCAPFDKQLCKRRVKKFGIVKVYTEDESRKLKQIRNIFSALVIIKTAIRFFYSQSQHLFFSFIDET